MKNRHALVNFADSTSSGGDRTPNSSNRFVKGAARIRTFHSECRAKCTPSRRFRSRLEAVQRATSQLRRFSKPPPSASRPPHRTPASICDQDTYTETLDSEAVKATPVHTVAFNAKCNHKRALYRRYAPRFGHTVGHTVGHTRRVFARPVQKTEGKRVTATVFQTATLTEIRTKTGRFRSSSSGSLGTLDVGHR